MGEIADMMLDGTMDCETGEWNFDGEDGPGWPMTGAEAAAFKRSARTEFVTRDKPAYKPTKKVSQRIAAFGELVNHDAFHWQVRDGRRVVADWWPHKHKFRMAGATSTDFGDCNAFIAALKKATAK